MDCQHGDVNKFKTNIKSSHAKTFVGKRFLGVDLPSTLKDPLQRKHRAVPLETLPVTCTVIVSRTVLDGPVSGHASAAGSNRAVADTVDEVEGDVGGIEGEWGIWRKSRRGGEGDEVLGVPVLDGDAGVVCGAGSQAH